MDAARLRQLLAYCRLEEFEGDSGVTASVEALFYAAVDYLKAAGVTESPKNQARFDLAVNGLVLNWYDNRGSFVDRPVSEIPLGVSQLIHQLQNC